jgi:hypothetical protein
MANQFGRALVIIAGLVGCAISPGSANASTIDYDLTLTPLFPGGVGGSGTLIVDDVSGHVTVAELDITMNNGVVFDFAGKNLTDASASIFQGNLVGLEGSDTNKQNSLDLFTSWPFGLGATFDQQTYELVSAVDPPPGSTPLPPSWTLMLIGIVIFGICTGRRSRRNSEAFAAR